jgi:hypothetical protein
MTTQDGMWQIPVRNTAGGKWPLKVFRQQQDIILVPPGTQAQALTLDDAIKFHEHLGELIQEARTTR